MLAFGQDHAPGRSRIGFHLPYNKIVLSFIKDTHPRDGDPDTNILMSQLLAGARRVKRNQTDMQSQWQEGRAKAGT